MIERCPAALPPGRLPPPVSYRLAFLAALLVAPSLVSSLAHAQEEPSPGSVDRAARREREAQEAEDTPPPRTEASATRYGLRISGFGQFGFLGKIRLNPEADTPGGIHFSYGGNVRMTYPVARHFVAGGEFGFRRFRTDGGEDGTPGYGRSTFFQINAVLQPRLPITLKNGKLLELMVTIPVGLGITSPSQNWQTITGGAGLAIGGLGTIQYYIAPRLIWSFEGGWVHQFTWHGIEGPGDITRMSSGQLVLRLGFGIRI